MAEGTGAAPSAAPAGAPGSPAQPQSQPTGAKPGETAAQTQARLIKLALDGQEVELPESEVVANLKKGRNAAQLLSKVEQRRQEALKAQAQADGILGRLKDKGNLRSVLSDLGYSKDDLRAMSEQTILEDIQLEKMSPAERRAYEAEQRVKALEEQQERARKSEEERAHAAEVARHKDEFSNLFLETMERTGLPKSSGRFVVQRMAALYAQNEEAGLESTPEEMAAHVMRGLEAEHRGVLSGLEGDALLQRLGPDVVKKVLGAHLASIRKRQGQGAAAAPQQQPVRRPATPVDPRKGKWADIEALIKGK